MMSGVNITDVVESVLVAAGQPRAVFLLKSLRYLPVFVRSPTIAAAVLTTCGILLVFLVKSHAFQYLREQAHDIQMNIWPRPWTVSVTNADSHCRALEIFLESKVKFLHRPGFEACQRPATGSEKGDFSRGLKHQSHNGEIFVTYKDRSDFVTAYQLAPGWSVFEWENQRYHIQRKDLGHDRDHTDRYRLTISAYSTTGEPIVKLIQAAKDFEQAATSDKVEVRMLIIQPHSPTTPTWMLFNHLSPRPLATVALDQDKMTDLIKDFNDSLKPEKAVYNKLRGIPYKRVYLFHGPPGTGKSSTILALAGFFGLPLYFLSLNAEGLDDGTLQMAIKWVPTRCIIAIEEIDTARLSRKKGSQDLPGPTLGAVLSVLDGIATSPGRIFILTSNKPGDLDEALVRPGRTDYKLEFTKSNSQMSEELFKNIYHTVIDESSLNSMAMRFGEVTPDGKYSAADIQALLLKYEDDPEKAIEGMMEQVKRDRLHCDNFPPLLKTPVSQLPNDEFDPGTRRSSF